MQVHGKGQSFKDVVSKSGFKKNSEVMSACGDLVRVEDKGGGNITYYPKGK